MRNSLKQQIFAVVTGSLIRTLGSVLFEFGVGIYLLKKTGSSAQYALVLMIGPIVMLALLPISGSIIDRFDHAKIIRFSQIINVISLLLFSIFYFLAVKFFLLEILILVIILRATGLFISNTLNSSLRDLIPLESLHRVNSLNQTGASIANILSPALGAVLFSLLPFEMFALVQFVTEFLAMLLFLRLNFSFVENKTIIKVKHDQHIWKDFTAGLKYVRLEHLPRLATLSNAVTNFFIASINVGMAFTEVTFLHMTNAQFGFTEMSFGVGMLLAGLFLSARSQFRFPARASMLAAVILGLTLIPFGIPEWFHTSRLINVGLFAFYNFIAGVLVVIKQTPILSLLQTEVPTTMQGRVFTLQTTLGALLSPLGAAAYGILFGVFTPAPIYTVTGLLMAGLLVWLMFRYQDVMNITTK